MCLTRSFAYDGSIGRPASARTRSPLLRAQDGAKEDHAVWRTQVLGGDHCDYLTKAQQAVLENDVPHLLAENAPSGDRNGLRCGIRAEDADQDFLRIASADALSPRASSAPDDN